MEKDRRGGRQGREGRGQGWEGREEEGEGTQGEKGGQGRGQRKRRGGERSPPWSFLKFGAYAELSKVHQTIIYFILSSHNSTTVTSHKNMTTL